MKAWLAWKGLHGIGYCLRRYPALKTILQQESPFKNSRLGRQSPDSRMLAYRMHLPETVVGLCSTKIKGNSRMKDGMPFGYWESCDSRHDGVIMDIKENGLCVRSLVDMHIGAELRIRIFFSLGNEFCRFQVLARTIGKELCCGEGWKAYEYELEFVEMSEQDRLGIRQTGNIYS